MVLLSKQVTNRDISILVLKYFLKQREKEINEGTLKPKKRAKPVRGGPPRQYVLDPNVSRQASEAVLVVYPEGELTFGVICFALWQERDCSSLFELVPSVC